MRLLLHVCCGPCACAAIRHFMIEGYNVKAYYYNPNIHPKDEYEKRKEEVSKVTADLDVGLITERYDRQCWFEEVKGFQYEPEGGQRCNICFYLRIKRTHQEMKQIGADRFATTLTVSPHKDASKINRIGYEIGQDRYLPSDLKKRGGYQKSVAISKKMGLYRQKYCGCIYSLENSIRKGSSGRGK